MKKAHQENIDPSSLNVSNSDFIENPEYRAEPLILKTTEKPQFTMENLDTENPQFMLTFGTMMKSNFERKMEFRKSEEKKFREELRQMKKKGTPTAQ